MVLHEARKERYTPLVTTGKDQINLQSLNEIIRQAFTSIYTLEGRAGLIKLQDSVQIDGGLTVAQESPDNDYSLDVSGTFRADPIVSQYTSLANAAGTGVYTWDGTISEDSTYFTTFATDTEIVTLKAGTYMVVGQLAATTDGAGTVKATISLDGVVISTVLKSSLGASSTTSVPISGLAIASANSVISVALATGDGRLGDAVNSSTLTIYRLN